MKDVRMINVPMYDELAVKSNWKQVLEDEKLASYFPSDISDKKLPEREYFYAVINTLYPEYIPDIIASSKTVRFKAEKDQPNKDAILVTEQWQTDLLRYPYFS